MDDAGMTRPLSRLSREDVQESGLPFPPSGTGLDRRSGRHKERLSNSGSDAKDDPELTRPLRLRAAGRERTSAYGCGWAWCRGEWTSQLRLGSLAGYVVCPIVVCVHPWSWAPGTVDRRAQAVSRWLQVASICSRLLGGSGAAGARLSASTWAQQLGILDAALTRRRVLVPVAW